MVAAAGTRMLEMMTETNELQDRLHDNTEYFVEKMLKAGFDIKSHAIGCLRGNAL